MSRLLTQAISGYQRKLDEAEAIINLVKHQTGPAGEKAWAYYQKYMVDTKK